MIAQESKVLVQGFQIKILQTSYSGSGRMEPAIVAQVLETSVRYVNERQNYNSPSIKERRERPEEERNEWSCSAAAGIMGCPTC